MARETLSSSPERHFWTPMKTFFIVSWEKAVFEVAKRHLAKRAETEDQRKMIDTIFTKLRTGEKITPSEIMEGGILGKKSLETENFDKIPKQGPLLVVTNHDSEDILSGFGTILMVSYVLEKARNGKHPIWLQAGKSENFILKKTPLLREAAAVVNERMGNAYDSIFVDRNGERKFPNSGLKIFNAFRRGEVVAMHPEAQIGPSLCKIDERASDLLKLIPRFREKLKTPVQVIPIVSFMEEDSIIVRTGDEVILNQDEDCGQKTMEAIAGLLPPRKQGFYFRS